MAPSLSYPTRRITEGVGAYIVQSGAGLNEKEKSRMSPRIPYVSADSPGEAADIIRRRRGGHLLDLDRTLLHNPETASGWNALLGAVRTGTTSLDPRVRELAICWVAVLNGAEYAWTQHAPLAIEAGVEESLMASLRRGDTSELDSRRDDEVSSLVVAFTTAMTRQVIVPPDLFERARQEFGDVGVHDLVLTVATYNMVTRYLVALHVGE